MKTLLLAMTLLLLCSSQVLAFKCVTCTNELDSDCKGETECDATDNFCKLVSLGESRITRSCEEFCTEDENTSCCDSPCVE